MSQYAKLIKEATGCTNEEVPQIEDFMRNAIFQSTLDFQSKAVLVQAARDAKECLSQIGEPNDDGLYL